MKMGMSFHPMALLLPIQTHITTLRTGSPTIHISNSSWQTSFTNVAKCLRETLMYYSALWTLYSHLTVTPHLFIIIPTCMKKLMQWLLAKIHGSILLWKTVAHCPRVFPRQTFPNGWPTRIMSGFIISDEQGCTCGRLDLYLHPYPWYTHTLLKGKGWQGYGLTHGSPASIIISVYVIYIYMVLLFLFVLPWPSFMCAPPAAHAPPTPIHAVLAFIHPWPLPLFMLPWPLFVLLLLLFSLT